VRVSDQFKPGGRGKDRRDWRRKQAAPMIAHLERIAALVREASRVGDDDWWLASKLMEDFDQASKSRPTGVLVMASPETLQKVLSVLFV
jgi:hypothetical protein